jgi:hypothetical protein
MTTFIPGAAESLVIFIETESYSLLSTDHWAILPNLSESVILDVSLISPDESSESEELEELPDDDRVGVRGRGGDFGLRSATLCFLRPGSGGVFLPDFLLLTTLLIVFLGGGGGEGERGERELRFCFLCFGVQMEQSSSEQELSLPDEEKDEREDL